MWLADSQVYNVHNASFRTTDTRIEGDRIADLAKAFRPIARPSISPVLSVTGLIDRLVHICVDSTAGYPNNPWNNTLPNTLAL